MSIFTKEMATSQNENNNTTSFSNLSKFFDEVRKAKEFKIEDNRVSKLMEDIKNFYENQFISILLDDFLVKKSKQKEFLENFDNLKNLFYLSLDEPWNFDKKVVVAGRFSAGKSSVINKLINRDVLPTNVRPTTAIATQITNIGGKTNSIVKTINHDNPKVINTEVLKYLVKEEVEKFPIHLANVIEYIVINDTSLGDDIVIVDTPGFDPADKKNLEKDKKLMEDEFNRADCIIWVMDIADGDISRDALDVLKSIKDKELIVVVNKADSKPSKSERKKVLYKVKDTLTKNNIKYSKIISIGKNTYNLNFNRNAQMLRDLIKNIPTPQFNIFENIKEFLKGIYNNMVNLEKYYREELSFYENIQAQMDDNPIETAKFLANEFSKEEGILKYISDTVRNLINEHSKIDNLYSQLKNMWEAEYPIFGDDKYYIPMHKFDRFVDIQSDLIKANYDKGFWEGVLKKVIDNEIIKYKNELQKVDGYISQINRAIKEVENIENLYKRYQLTKTQKEIELDFSFLGFLRRKLWNLENILK